MHERAPKTILRARKVRIYEGLWSETSHLGGTSYLAEVLFILRLHEKYIPPDWDTFYYSQPVSLFLSSDVTFIVYLFQFQFTYLFQFRITNKHPHFWILQSELHFFT